MFWCEALAVDIVDADCVEAMGVEVVTDVGCREVVDVATARGGVLDVEDVDVDKTVKDTAAAFKHISRPRKSASWSKCE